GRRGGQQGRYDSLGHLEGDRNRDGAASYGPLAPQRNARHRDTKRHCRAWRELQCGRQIGGAGIPRQRGTLDELVGHRPRGHRNDVSLEINRTSVNSIADVKSALEKAGDKPVLVLISRRGQTIYLTVRPE